MISLVISTACFEEFVLSTAYFCFEDFFSESTFQHETFKQVNNGYGVVQIKVPFPLKAEPLVLVLEFEMSFLRIVKCMNLNFGSFM